MPEASRSRAALACLAAAVALAGCFTPQSKPKPSQAIAEARARHNAPAGSACPQTPLAAASPVAIGFGFGDASLSDYLRQPLGEAARWLACHPAVPVLIKPDADGHGADAEQDALARKRAETVRAELVARGVAAQRISVLGRKQAEPAGEHLLVRAEGRRW